MLVKMVSCSAQSLLDSDSPRWRKAEASEFGSRNGGRSELIDVLISRRWIEQFGGGFNGDPALEQLKI